MNFLSAIVKFFTGSRTLALTIELVMLVGRAYDKGIKENADKIRDFVYDKLPDDLKTPQGPIEKDELKDVVVKVSDAVEAVYNLFHK